MRRAPGLAWLGPFVVLAGVDCRMERVEPKGQQPQRGESVQAAAPALLVSVGATETELETAARAVCGAAARGARAQDGLQEALAALECARRSAGEAFARASLLDGARWGAASAVPAEYLASEAAARALALGGGLVYGAEPLLPLAGCALAATAELSAFPDSEQAAGPRPEPQVDAADEADAGAETIEAAHELPDSPDAPPAGHDIVALLLRDDAGDFHAALLASGAGPPGAPPGVALLPGQLLFAGADAIVFADPGEPRDFARDPAPAAALYTARLPGAPGAPLPVRGVVLGRGARPRHTVEARAQAVDAEGCVELQRERAR